MKEIIYKTLGLVIGLGFPILYVYKCHQLLGTIKKVY